MGIPGLIVGKQNYEDAKFLGNILNFVDNNPHSLIVFNDTEEIDSNYAAFFKIIFTTGEFNKVDFTNTIIVFTSSLGKSIYEKSLTNDFSKITKDEIVNALTNAVKKGVDVRIVTPHIPDKKITFGITRSHYRVLLKNGVKIYEYTPGFIHMKMFVVDDIYATVGTINLDYRSLYLHLENSTFMYRCYCIADMKKDFMDIFKVSEEVTYQRYKKYVAPRRFIWSVLRMFAPLL